MCSHVRVCAKARAGGREGGGLYTRLNTGDLWVGGGCLVGGTLAGDGGTAELAAVSAFSGTLYRTDEQRSEPHFYTLLGTLPCQSFPPLAPEWVFFSLFLPPRPSPASVSAYGSGKQTLEKQNAHCRTFFSFFSFSKVVFILD